jgi:hypothetical protein
MSRDCLEIFEVTCVFVRCLRDDHVLRLAANHSAVRTDSAANQP